MQNNNKYGSNDIKYFGKICVYTILYIYIVYQMLDVVSMSIFDVWCSIVNVDVGWILYLHFYERFLDWSVYTPYIVDIPNLCWTFIDFYVNMIDLHWLTMRDFLTSFLLVLYLKCFRFFVLLDFLFLPRGIFIANMT